jgi:Tfp pilus assembly protein PilE
MKQNKGITMVALVITIVILLILAGISVGVGNKAITVSKLENLKTDMLLIEVKAKQQIESANFDLGTNFDSASEEEKNNRLTKALSEFIGEEIEDGNIFAENIELTTENINSEKENLVYYYKLTTQNLKDMGLNNLKSDDKNGWYIIKYDIKNIEIEIYNTSGFENDGNTVYSLTEIEKIK